MGKGEEEKNMSKKELAKVFNEVNVEKLIEQFNTNVNSAVKNVTKNCILLAKANDGDFTEVKNRLVEKQGLSGGAISQMRGAGVVYREIKSINDVSYTKVYEIARFDRAISKLPIDDRIKAYTSLVGYVETATSTDISLEYESEKEAILRTGISNKELKIAVDCALEDSGLKKIKAIEKNTEETSEETTEESLEEKDVPEMVVYMTFLDLGDSEKMSFLKMLKDNKYIDRINNTWK